VFAAVSIRAAGLPAHVIRAIISSMEIDDRESADRSTRFVLCSAIARDFEEAPLAVKRKIPLSESTSLSGHYLFIHTAFCRHVI
jgi:hypothetical protein